MLPKLPSEDDHVLLHLRVDLLLYFTFPVRLVAIGISSRKTMDS